MPLAIIWRSRILLKAIKAVSEAEKKKDNSARIDKNNNTTGKENIKVILVLKIESPRTISL
jgi:hypothetical protein